MCMTAETESRVFFTCAVLTEYCEAHVAAVCLVAVDHSARDRAAVLRPARTVRTDSAQPACVACG